jgi:Concanavalin A-like lectin/glucanases superfamily
MGTNIMTPPIVTNGLVLALDAANTKSYISGSTTWSDLSGNGYNGKLIQSASFNNINGGAISFNGVSSSITITSNVLQDFGGTINTWVYPIAAPTVTGYILSAFGTNTDRYYVSQGGDSLQTTRGNPASSVTFTSSVTYNKWYNLTSTWVSSSLGSSLSGYLNGVLVGSTPITASGTTSTLTIGGYVFSGQSFSGSIALTQIYNRALSATEVLQNYNALKSRFNLI